MGGSWGWGGGGGGMAISPRVFIPSTSNCCIGVPYVVGHTYYYLYAKSESPKANILEVMATSAKIT